MGEAPAAIVVVDTLRDPLHHLEAGAAATQNMALMGWAGVAGLRGNGCPFPNWSCTSASKGKGVRPAGPPDPRGHRWVSR